MNNVFLFRVCLFHQTTNSWKAMLMPLLFIIITSSSKRPVVYSRHSINICWWIKEWTNEWLSQLDFVDLREGYPTIFFHLSLSQCHTNRVRFIKCLFLLTIVTTYKLSQARPLSASHVWQNLIFKPPLVMGTIIPIFQIG